MASSAARNVVRYLTFGDLMIRFSPIYSAGAYLAVHESVGDLIDW